MFKPDIYICNYTTEDYGALINLWKATDLGDSNRGDNEETIEKTLKLGGNLFLLKKNISHELIGSAWITNDGRRLHLHHFGIMPSFQSLGFGNFLAEYCIEFAKEKNMQIKLEVHKTNLKAIKLYQKFGFQYLGDYDIYIIRDSQKIK